VSPALAETDRGDVALSGQDVTPSHAMLTEVAQAFVGIVAGFGIKSCRRVAGPPIRGRDPPESEFGPGQ